MKMCVYKCLGSTLASGVVFGASSKTFSDEPRSGLLSKSVGEVPTVTREARVLPSLRIRSRNAFLLMEMVIALGIFAFGAVGLTVALNRIMDAALLSRKDQWVRLELESRYAESQLLPLVEEKRDLGRDAMGIEYARTVEVLPLQNQDGLELQGLFKVRLTARDPIRGEELNFIEVYVLQP